jgi:hypothetical protein
MRVILEYDNQTKFELAGRDKDTVSDFVIQGTRLGEVAEFLRAESALPLDRKNRRLAISFRVTREHADVNAAEKYILEHEGRIKHGAGKVYFVSGGGNLPGFILTITNVLLEACESTYLGVSTFHSYRMQGQVLDNR